MMTRILPLVLLPIHPLFSLLHSIREHPWQLQMWRCAVKINGFYITQFCRRFFSSTDSSYLVNCIFSLFPLHHTFGYESEKKKVWQGWRKVAVLTLLPCDRFSRSRNEGASLCRKYVGMLIPSTRLSFFAEERKLLIALSILKLFSNNQFQRLISSLHALQAGDLLKGNCVGQLRNPIDSQRSCR